jgi:hypothetical protein
MSETHNPNPHIQSANSIESATIGLLEEVDAFVRQSETLIKTTAEENAGRNRNLPALPSKEAAIKWGFVGLSIYVLYKVLK